MRRHKTRGSPGGASTERHAGLVYDLWPLGGDVTQTLNEFITPKAALIHDALHIHRAVINGRNNCNAPNERFLLLGKACVSPRQFEL